MSQKQMLQNQDYVWIGDWSTYKITIGIRINLYEWLVKEFHLEIYAYKKRWLLATFSETFESTLEVLGNNDHVVVAANCLSVY